MTSQNDLLMGFNFRVSAAGNEFRASKVRNIEQSVTLETVREGGCNNAVHTLVKPSAETKKLVFERGFCAAGEGQALEKLLGVAQRQPLMIHIYDRKNQNILKTYQVENWMLVKWQLSDLDAAAGGLLLETAEVAYETLKGG